MAAVEKEKILKELSSLTDHNDKFRYLIKKGKAQKPMPNEYKIDKYRIEGCLSKLWLYSEFKDGKVYFSSDSDAAIPKGIAAILTEVYSDYTPEEALMVDINFLKESGIEQHLSMNRSNGLSKLVEQIKMYIVVYKQIANKS